MSTRELRRRIVHTLRDTGGLLGAAAFAELLIYARRGWLTAGEKTLLVQPAALVASDPVLAAAGLGLGDLRYEDGVVETILEHAQTWGIPAALGPNAAARPPAADADTDTDTDTEADTGRGRGPLFADAVDLGDPLDWTLRTAGADVAFSTRAHGRRWPALVMTRPRFADPAADAPAPHQRHRDRIRAAADAPALAAVLADIVAEEADWFSAAGLPAEGRSPGRVQNRRFGVQSLRRTAFLDGVRDLCIGRPGVGLAVHRVVAELRDDMLHGRDHQMATGRHENYWPYWKNFVGVLETLGRQLPDDSPGAGALRNRVRDLLRRKHVFGYQRAIDEQDAETTLGGVVVVQPPHSRGPGRRASLVPGASVWAPRYETLQLAEHGLPAAHAALAGAPVYRHAADDLRFDVAPAPGAAVAWEPGAAVPPALLPHVQATPVPADDPLGLRAPLPGERLRTGLPLDWNRSGQIQVAPIQIGWWGHCHNEAPANALGMDPQKPVTLYRAERSLPADRAQARYDIEDCWDIVGAFTSDHEGARIRDPRTGRVSSPGYVVLGSGGHRPTRVDRTSFVGNRNNGGHWFEVVPDIAGGRRVRVDAEVTEIWGLEDPTHRYPVAGARFRRDIEQPDGGFAPNPDWVEAKMADDDVITVQAAGRRMTLETRFITFDDQGHRVERTATVALDPAAPGWVKLADEVEHVAPGGGGRLVEHWYEPAAQRYRAVAVHVHAVDGQWQRETTTTREAAATAVTASQETTYDSVVELDAYVVADMGLPLTFDTSSGQAVWNYPVDRLRRDRLRRITREENGVAYTYTTIQLHFTTVGGPAGQPRYILKRDPHGRVVRALALDPMPDFAFRNELWVCAPLAEDHSGQPAVNLRGLTAGYLTAPDGQSLVTELWERQAIVLYASMSDATPADHAWLFETTDGRLLSFPDADRFAAAVAADRAQRGPAPLV